MWKKSVLLPLFIIFLLAYILRVLYLPGLALTFGYDQARDAHQSIQISKGDLKILGPSASTPGLYHGVLYYYILAPAYALGSGSPIIAAGWIAFLNALTVILVFSLTRQLVKSTTAGFLASLIFAISFEATQYALWLSNPTIGVWTVPLVYFGLWNWLKNKKKWGVVVCAIGLGMSVQAEIFLLYHLAPVLLWLYVRRKEINLKQILLFGAVFTICISTMILVEFKFGFKGLGGFASLAQTGEQVGFGKSLGDYILLYFNQLGRVLAYTTYPGNVGIGGLSALGLMIFFLLKWNKKGLAWQPFLASWIFSHATVVSVGGASTPFLLVGIGTAVAILLGISIWYFFANGNRAPAVLFLCVVIFGNISMIIRENPRGQTIFSIQKDMLLSKQLQAIDYTYKAAEGKPFSINTLTSPLWINIVWTYLYKWHGQSQYGYIPSWQGRDQVGQLDSLPPDTNMTGTHYLIVEPMAGIPPQYLPLTVGEEDSRSKLLETINFGEIVVQKRQAL